MGVLKLIALDTDDLEVVSTHLQDALVKVGDIMWRPAEQRLIVVANRFDWEDAVCCNQPRYQRRLAALRFERVHSLKARKVNPAEKDAVLNLLAIEFAATDSPSGHVILTFSGGAALRLDVECLEAELADLGPVWAAEGCPKHAGDTELA